MAKKPVNPSQQKAKPMAKTAASTKPVAKDTSKAIATFVDPKALANKQAGQRIVSGLCASSAQIEELEGRLDTERSKRGALVSEMTQMFIDAGKNDRRINFAIANGEDKKAKNLLFNKCRAVLGIIDVRINPDGTEVMTQAAWADEMFPRIGETAKNSKEGETFTARETNRANFTARIRDACKTANAVLSTGMNSEIDKATGLLAVSGKAVKEHFKYDGKVILNEKQSFKADGKDVTLAAKPTVSEIARMGGAVTRQRAGGPATPVVNPANNEQVAAQIAKWQAIVEKLASFDDNVATALDNLADAIDKAKERNEKAAAA